MAQKGDPPVNPLFRRVFETADSHRHIIASRAITLVPNPDPNNLSVHPDSVLYWVAEGKASPSRVRIFAEDIYVHAGSRFNFPGKTVSIFANRIIALPRDGSDEIVFDLSGEQGAEASTAADNGENGANGEYILDPDSTPLFPRTGKEVLKPTKDGGNGKDGTTAGSVGGSGGHFCITARLFALSEKPIHLVVKSSGGKGGKGQSGGNGGSGGNGAQPKAQYSPDQYIRAGNGGNGGKGSDGASGGEGGTVVSLCSAFASVSSLPTTDANLRQVLSFEEGRCVVSGGEKGASGSSGSGGSKGQRGFYFVWQPFGPNTQKFGPDGSDGSSPSTPESKAAAGNAGNQFHANQQSSEAILPNLVDPVQLILVMNRLLFEYQLLFTAQSAQIEDKSSGGAKDAQPNTPDSKEPAPSTGPETKDANAKGWNRQSDERLLSRRAMFQESFAWVGRLVASINIERDPSLADALNAVGIDAARQTTLRKHFPLDGWAGQAPARQQLILMVQKLVNSTSSSAPHDMFDCPIDKISRPNLSLADVSKSVTSLVEIEKHKLEVEAVLAEQTVDRNKAIGMMVSLTKEIESYETDKSAIESKLTAQYKVVQTARSKSQKTATEVKVALDKFWGKIKSSFSCQELAEVMSAVGNVFMFAHPGAGAVFKLGGLLSAGAAASKLGSSVKTAEGHIEKDALHGKFYTLNADLKDAQLKGEIEMKNKEIRSLSGADAEFVSAIVTERANFQKLCNQYFSRDDLSLDEAKELKEAKKVFDDYVDDCQAYHTAVLEYNSIALELANFQLEHKQKKITMDALQNTSVSPDAIYGSMVFSFYKAVYTFQKAKVLRLLFEAVRTINGVFLSRSTLFDDLWGYQCFENISSTDFDTALKSRLADDVDKYKQRWLKNQTSEIKNRVVVLRKDKHARLINTMKTTGRCAFYFTPDDAINEHGWSKQWFDVRLLQMYVYLVGAKNKHAIDDVPETQVVDVNIEMGTRVVVLSEDYLELTFEIPESNFPFEYNYSKGKGKYEFSSKPGDKFVLGMFQWDVNMENRTSLCFANPMRSPFARQVFSVDDNVDTEGVEEIHIHYDLQVRSSGKERGVKT